MFHIQYRPEKLIDFVGNTEVIKDLQSKHPKYPQTILISGPSGCGKTTLARIIGKELNCSPFYFKEIDAAQDRGIDVIRAISNKDAYARPLSGNVKFFVFDEAHMLTNESQNGLLKIVEEPPLRTYFIFCSTAPEKLIVTLRNRCYKIQLKPVTDKEIALLIKYVAEKEHITFTDTLKQICKFILQESKGVPREALILFESLKDCTSLETAQVKIHGFQDEDPKIFEFIKVLITRNYDQIIKTFQELPQTNYESLRIAIARILKKFIFKENNLEKREKLFNLYMFFRYPVDNTIGDIELLCRFWELKETK